MRVLGRVERFGGRLQVQVRTVEAAPDSDPAELTPTMRRDPDELDGFLDFLAGEITHDGLAAVVARILGDDGVRLAFRALPAAGADGHHGYAGGLLEHTVGVATLCRETAQLHPRLRSDLLAAAALLHDVGRTLELGPRPGVPPDGGGAPARSRPSRPAPDRGAIRRLDAAVRAELLHAVAVASRPAGCAHRRGRRALPREPARRAGRDPARRGVAAMTAVVLALAAAALWGTGDFFGGLATRRLLGADGAVLVAARRPAGRSSSGSRSAALSDPARGCCTRPVQESRARSGSAASTAAWRSVRWGSWRRSRRHRRSCRSPSPCSAATRRRHCSGPGSRSRSAGSCSSPASRRQAVGGRVAAGVGLALVAALGFGLFVVGLGEAAQESAAWATATARAQLRHCTRRSRSPGRARVPACLAQAAPARARRRRLRHRRERARSRSRRRTARSGSSLS